MNICHSAEVTWIVLSLRQLTQQLSGESTNCVVEIKWTNFVLNAFGVYVLS
jgi:hypothetical protein